MHPFVDQHFFAVSSFIWLSILFMSHPLPPSSCLYLFPPLPPSHPPQTYNQKKKHRVICNSFPCSVSIFHYIKLILYFSLLSNIDGRPHSHLQHQNEMKKLMCYINA